MIRLLISGFLITQVLSKHVTSDKSFDEFCSCLKDFLNAAIKNQTRHHELKPSNINNQEASPHISPERGTDTNLEGYKKRKSFDNEHESYDHEPRKPERKDSPAPSNSNSERKDKQLNNKERGDSRKESSPPEQFSGFSSYKKPDLPDSYQETKTKHQADKVATKISDNKINEYTSGISPDFTNILPNVVQGPIDGQSDNPKTNSAPNIDTTPPKPEKKMQDEPAINANSSGKLSTLVDETGTPKEEIHSDSAKTDNTINDKYKSPVDSASPKLPEFPQAASNPVDPAKLDDSSSPESNSNSAKPTLPTNCSTEESTENSSKQSCPPVKGICIYVRGQSPLYYNCHLSPKPSFIY